MKQKMLNKRAGLIIFFDDISSKLINIIRKIKYHLSYNSGKKLWKETLERNSGKKLWKETLYLNLITILITHASFLAMAHLFVN